MVLKPPNSHTPLNVLRFGFVFWVAFPRENPSDIYDVPGRVPRTPFKALKVMK